jgi:cell division protein FtsB
MVSGQSENKKNKKLNKLFKSEWITNNLVFILFVSFLIVLYIANGHIADKTIRDISKTKNEITDLQYQYKTLKSEVMYKTEESEILKQVQPMGLQINKELPVKIYINKK